MSVKEDAHENWPGDACLVRHDNLHNWSAADLAILPYPCRTLAKREHMHMEVRRANEDGEME